MTAGDERGAGLIGLIGGVTVFLGLLLFAVQLLVNLYATEALTTAAYDAARAVASGDVDHEDPSAVVAAEARAEATAARVLGAYGDSVLFDWTVDAASVRLRVQATNPRFVLPVLGGALGFDTVDRTVTVRVESWR